MWQDKEMITGSKSLTQLIGFFEPVEYVQTSVLITSVGLQKVEPTEMVGNFSETDFESSNLKDKCKIHQMVSSESNMQQVYPPTINSYKTGQNFIK